MWHIKVRAVDFPTQLLRTEELKNAVEQHWCTLQVFMNVRSDYYVFYLIAIILNSTIHQEKLAFQAKYV